jgi:16S rRNA (cytosine967-C5)-methyltransferase
VVRRVFEHDAWANRAFGSAAERHGLDGRDRAQAQRLAFGSVQRRGTSDHLIDRLTGRSPEALDPPVVAALRLGLFELLFSGAAAHAAVDGAVELAKGGMRKGGARRAGGAAGLVNATLRRALREREQILASLSDESPESASVAHSVPEWLARMWWAELGAGEARSLLAAMNEPAETAMRVNLLRADPANLRASLGGAGEPVAPAVQGDPLHFPQTLVWDGPLGAAARKSLSEGRMFAQSRGAQAVVRALDPQPGERILDLCAGPGVKTTAVAASGGDSVRVQAVERDPGRAGQIEDLAALAGAANIRIEIADAAEYVADAPFDRVLVDPPCSDLGTLASRPDARWRKDPEAPARLAPIQESILTRGLDALRPGGTLVYSTCTISKRENEDVIERVLAARSGLEEVRRFATRPDRDRTDGFFVCVLRRSV